MIVSLWTKFPGLYWHQGYLEIHMISCQLGIIMSIDEVVLEVHTKSSAETVLIMSEFVSCGVLPCEISGP